MQHIKPAATQQILTDVHQKRLGRPPTNKVLCWIDSGLPLQTSLQMKDPKASLAREYHPLPVTRKRLPILQMWDCSVGVIAVENTCEAFLLLLLLSSCSVSPIPPAIINPQSAPGLECLYNLSVTTLGRDTRPPTLLEARAPLAPLFQEESPDFSARFSPFFPSAHPNETSPL